MKKSLNLLLLLVLILNVACVESESEEIFIQKVTIKVSAAVAVTISNDDNDGEEYKYGICSDGEIKVLPSITKDDLIEGSHDLFNEFDFEVNSDFILKNEPYNQFSQVSELNNTIIESMVQSALGLPEGDRDFQHLRKCIVRNLNVSETVYVGYDDDSKNLLIYTKKLSSVHPLPRNLLIKLNICAREINTLAFLLRANLLCFI